MTGVVFDIQKFTVHDGPGIRTAVFMKGCPLRCSWCQNPESVRKDPQISYFPNLCIGCGMCAPACPENGIKADGKELISKVYLALCQHCGRCAEACCSGALHMIGSQMSVEEVYKVVASDLPFYQSSGGGVTFTGGEPTYQPEFLTAMASLFKERGLHLLIETCGHFAWDSAAKAISLMDIVYLDIKHMDDAKHRRATGQGNAIIHENAHRIDALGMPIRVRVPLIPGFNDSPEDFSAILRFAASLKNLDKVQVEPYHRFGMSKYQHIGWGYSLTELEPPSDLAVTELLHLAESIGVPCTR
jgi:pyruvate formate lyase activating enzyme